MSETKSIEQVFDEVSPSGLDGLGVPAAESVTDVTPTPPADTPAPTPDLVAPAPIALSEESLVEVKVDGEVRHLPWKEASRLISGTAASTKRFQEAAEARKEAERLRLDAEARASEAAQLKQQLATVMQDPQKLAALYMAVDAQRRGAAPTAPAGAPTADPAAFVQEVMARAQQTTEQIVAQRFAEAEQARVASQINAELDAHVATLIADTPALKAIPGWTDKVYETVASMGPKDLSEAKEFIAQQVADIKRSFTSTLTETQKVATLAKAKAATGTERGGSPVLPAARQYTSLNDPQRDADMLAVLDQLLGT